MRVSPSTPSRAPVLLPRSLLFQGTAVDRPHHQLENDALHLVHTLQHSPRRYRTRACGHKSRLVNAAAVGWHTVRSRCHHLLGWQYQLYINSTCSLSSSLRPSSTACSPRDSRKLLTRWFATVPHWFIAVVRQASIFQVTHPSTDPQNQVVCSYPWTVHVCTMLCCSLDCTILSAMCDFCVHAEHSASYVGQKVRSNILPMGQHFLMTCAKHSKGRQARVPFLRYPGIS